MIASLTEIIDKFMEKEFFCPEYSTIERMKISRYYEMLNMEIQELVSSARYQTLGEMVEAAQKWELKLEKHQRKRKPVKVFAPSITSKKFKDGDN